MLLRVFMERDITVKPIETQRSNVLPELERINTNRLNRRIKRVRALCFLVLKILKDLVPQLNRCVSKILLPQIRNFSHKTPYRPNLMLLGPVNQRTLKELLKRELNVDLLRCTRTLRGNSRKRMKYFLKNNLPNEVILVLLDI